MAAVGPNRVPRFVVAPELAAQSIAALEARFRDQAARLREGAPACARGPLAGEACGAFRASLRELAAAAHRQGQRQKDSGLRALALDLYQEYFRVTPPTEPGLYEVTFYAGELLWTLERWTEAAAHYRKVLELDPGGRYAKEARLGSELAERNAARQAGGIEPTHAE